MRESLNRRFQSFTKKKSMTSKPGEEFEGRTTRSRTCMTGAGMYNSLSRCPGCQCRSSFVLRRQGIRLANILLLSRIRASSCCLSSTTGFFGADATVWADARWAVASDDERGWFLRTDFNQMMISIFPFMVGVLVVFSPRPKFRLPRSWFYHRIRNSSIENPTYLSLF